MDAPFDIERSINGETAERSLGARREHCAPLQADLREWAHLQDRLVRDRGAALDLAPAFAASVSAAGTMSPSARVRKRSTT